MRQSNGSYPFAQRTFASFPSAAAPFRSATALRCLTQSVLMTTAPLSFHCNIRLCYQCSRETLACQFDRIHKYSKKMIV